MEAGVDEAGRGPLAGAVFAAAVVMPGGFEHPLLNDSKKVSVKNRNLLRTIIEREAVAWAVVSVDAKIIDEINILEATYQAMNGAIRGLGIEPTVVLVDGNRFKNGTSYAHRTVVGGDAKHVSIAAASILAKTHRDEYMAGLHAEYPQYNWIKNQGYPTAEHVAAIARYGLTPYHRLTFHVPELKANNREND